MERIEDPNPNPNPNPIPIPKPKPIPNPTKVEKIESENGLDDVVAQLMQLSRHKQEWVYDEEKKASTQQLVPREEPVPIIYALT